MITFIKKNWVILIILLFDFSLFATNYSPGTFLLGWDNLYPEFNFKANLLRSIAGVWQYNRGLGLLDGMAHTANLMHTLFLWILSLILPLSLLRYFFIFLMHFLGGVGIYCLIKKSDLGIKKENKEIFSFIGALFYQYNFGTVQMFYAPLEVFVIHFAALPWLTLFLLNYLKEGSKKNLLLFFTVSLLFTSQAFVPSVFIAYLISVLSILLFYFIHNKKESLKKIVIISGVIFAVNAFWIVPYFYSSLKNASVIATAKINIMSNIDITLKQKEFGDIKNVFLIRGFLLNTVDYQQELQQFDYMMKQWKSYIDNPLTLSTSILFLLIAFLGIINTVYRKKKILYPFILTFFASVFFLGSRIPLLSNILVFLDKHIPYLTIVFRFTFTKFIFLYVFSYTVLFIAGLDAFNEKIKLDKKILGVLFGLLLIVYTFLSFRGGFIYEKMRVNVLTDYFATFDYFKTQDKYSRIAYFPIQQYWSWNTYGWGARGSGFLWYGIEQAILDRAFDPWSKTNENYYWEISYATYSQNLPLLEKVLEKYQISWLLVDGNIISPDSPKSLYLDKLDDLLSQSQKITLAQTFGDIKVYRMQLSYQTQDFTFTVQNPVQVAPPSAWNNDDQAYVDNGIYFSYTDNRFPKTANQAYYPFRSLFTGRKQEELEFAVQDTKDTLVIRPKNNVEVSGQLTLETGKPDELSEIDRTDLSKVTIVTPKLFINGALVEGSAQITVTNLSSLWVEFPKVAGLLSYDSIKDDNLIGKTPVRCDTFRNGPIKRQPISGDGKELLRFSSIDSSNCMDIDLPNLPQNKSYIIAIDSRNIKGKSLFFSVINKNSRKSDIETYLPENNKSQNVSTSYFVLPPMEEFGVGYTLHFDNISIGDDEVINDLGVIAIYQFPYSMLKGIVFTSTQSPANQQMLVLSQSYDRGWKAYKIFNFQFSIFNWINHAFPFLFGEELKDHVLVNNWANGWILPEEKNSEEFEQIKIVYLPQYLEYIGFGLLIGAVIILFLYPSVRKHARVR